MIYYFFLITIKSILNLSDLIFKYFDLIQYRKQVSHDKIQKRYSSRTTRNHHSQGTIISSDKQNQKERVIDQKKRRQMDDLKYVLYIYNNLCLF